MHSLEWILAAGDGTGPVARLRQSLDAALAMPHSGTILRALVITALGMGGIYLMLPRGQSGRWPLDRYLGGALATLALVLFITVPISAGMVGLQGSGTTALWPLDDQPGGTCHTFHLLAFISLASAAIMITSRNPVYSALWFAMVLLGNSGLYLLQGAEFLSAATVIVYAGAIVVTFLFVIMLAQPTGMARYDRHSREPLLVTATGVVLASVLVGSLHYAARFEGWGREGGTVGSFRPSTETIADAAQFEKIPRIARAPSVRHVAGLGKSLFVDHVASVEVIGVLLLAAVAGAVLIAGHKVEGPGKREGMGPARSEN
jgi:NADH-quinone oxidoreductase subunit J